MKNRTLSASSFVFNRAKCINTSPSSNGPVGMKLTLVLSTSLAIVSTRRKKSSHIKLIMDSERRNRRGDFPQVHRIPFPATKKI
jgi:hypothetical protein